MKHLSNDTALETHQIEALSDLAETGRPYSGQILAELGFKLYRQYAKIGDIEVLENSITFCRRSLEFPAPTSRVHLIALGYLTISLSARYYTTGDIKDLEEGMSLERDIVLRCPPDDPNRSPVLVQSR